MLVSKHDELSKSVLEGAPGVDLVQFAGPPDMGTEEWAASLPQDPQQVKLCLESLIFSIAFTLSARTRQHMYAWTLTSDLVSAQLPAFDSRKKYVFAEDCPLQCYAYCCRQLPIVRSSDFEQSQAKRYMSSRCWQMKSCHCCTTFG